MAEIIPKYSNNELFASLTNTIAGTIHIANRIEFSDLIALKSIILGQQASVY